MFTDINVTVDMLLVVLFLTMLIFSPSLLDLIAFSAIFGVMWQYKLY